MSEYIEREALIKELESVRLTRNSEPERWAVTVSLSRVCDAPAADVEPVARCEKCRNGVPFDRNADIDKSCYLHCAIGRGEEVRNVWHKYKKYYKDYSVVDRDGFCDQGEAGEPDIERSGSGE